MFALQDVTWSTSTVLKQTLMQAFAAGITVAPGSLLPQLQDIDVCKVRKGLSHVHRWSAAKQFKKESFSGVLQDLQAWAGGQT